MTEAEAAEAADGPEARRRWRGEGVGLAACTFGSRAYRPCRLFRRHHTRTAINQISHCHVAVGRREQIRYMLFGKALINLRHLFVPTRHTFRVALSAFA
jgi:hypothetical protein